MLNTNEALALRLNKVDVIPVDNFKQASLAFRQYIEYNGLGQNGMHSKAGMLYHPTKGEFAYVSYNGRVWQGTDIGWRYGKGIEITDLEANDYEESLHPQRCA